MVRKSVRDDRLDFAKARGLLESAWSTVTLAGDDADEVNYIDDETLRTAIASSVNHRYVSYRLTVSKVAARDQKDVHRRMESADAAGQSVYRIDLFDLAGAVLALVGASGRVAFIRRVGDHLDRWATQPGHRQGWKRLLESL